MKNRSSLRCLKVRHPDNKVVRRGKRVYVINKMNRKYNARQGG
ncbi:ribosomal protein bL36 [Candidatus Sneabacter namystus]|uniref:Large ribosomal subunit protein bL36 n=1 Tax=Candidatus Sneabacter namystus TaxID=2601646 RepID=A0A5C0UH97_9RICK|nr:ribosomal protein bL36 [Candidatus Sneabacter namystus]QEK39515.1 50S ribosomal protein L36 [Candidatus Sneabacter namystus]